MEGFKTEIRFPVISHAQVIGYDSENNSINIQMPSGQQIMLEARMLYNGNADGIRVHQVPLPYIGSWGLVCFPYGDDRFPIWLGAYYPNVVNAITSDNSLDASQTDYYSHASGYYSLLDGLGQAFYRFPDGTEITVNSDNSQPTTYRHNIDEFGKVQRVVITDEERVPNPPSQPFYISLRHPTGTSETITPDGIISKKTGPGGVDTPTAGPILELNPLSSEKDAPQGTPAGGAQLIGQAGNSDIFMDKDGNIIIISNGSNTVVQINSTGNINIISGADINLNATGNVNIDSARDILLTTDLLPGIPGIMSVNDIITKYNSHTHHGTDTNGDTFTTDPLHVIFQLP
jgi:hypothetical protein